MFDGSSTAGTAAVPPFSTSSEPLSLEWVFGLQRDVKKAAIHNLSPNDDERIVFYTVANTGIIYNATNHTQRLLRGHRHTIVASACSADRRYVVTAERDNDDYDEDDNDEDDDDEDNDGEGEDDENMSGGDGENKNEAKNNGNSSKRMASNSRGRKGRTNGNGNGNGGGGGKRGRQRSKKKGLLKWNRHGNDDPLLLQQRGQMWKMGSSNSNGGDMQQDDNENEWDACGDALMIVWDVSQGLPVSTIPISRYGGVSCLDMSADGAYLVTVSNSAPQHIALWNWTASTQDSPIASSLLLKPILMRSIPAKDKQTVVRFNPEDPHVVLTNGALRIIFWSWAAAASASASAAVGEGGTTSTLSASNEAKKKRAKGMEGDDWEGKGEVEAGGVSQPLEWKYYSPPIPTIHSVFSKNAAAAAAAATSPSPNNNTTTRPSGFNQSKSGKAKNGSALNPQKQTAATSQVAGVPAVGRLTQSIFVPGTQLACSGTADGEVVLWGVQPSDRLVKSHDKTLLKQVRVNSTGSSGKSKSNAPCAVTCLTFAKGYIVVGSADGCVRFFDCKLRLVSWFEELNGGPITSISFDLHAEALLAAAAAAGESGGAEDRSSAFSTRAGSVDAAGSAHKSWKNQSAGETALDANATAASARLSFESTAALGLRAQPNAQELAVQQVAMRTCTDAAMGFEAPDFMVSTAHALIINVFATSFHSTNVAQRRGLLLVQGQDDAILALASHSAYPWLAIAGASGSLHLWDYTMKRVLMLRHFPGLQVQCMAFEQQQQQQQGKSSQSRTRGVGGASSKKRHHRPLGRLAVGFTNGLVKVLDVATLEDIFSVRVSTSFTASNVGAGVGAGTTKLPSSSSSSSLPVGILSICFSADGQYVAVSDSENCVGVLQCLLQQQQQHQSYGKHSNNGRGRPRGQQQQVQQQMQLSSNKKNASRGSIVGANQSHATDRSPNNTHHENGDGEGEEVVEEKEEWIYIGRHRAHQGRIVGLQFMPAMPPSSSSSASYSSAAAASTMAMSDNGSSTNTARTTTTLNEQSIGVERLISLGEDKRLVEYNTMESTEESGLLVLCAHNISQEAVPSGFFWSACPQLLDADSTPPNPNSNNSSPLPLPVSSSASSNSTSNFTPSPDSSSNPLDLLGIASSGYKLKLYCSDWKRQCVKTVLGPTFGGPMSALQVVSAPRGDGNGDMDMDIPNHNNSNSNNSNSCCLAYASRESVIGLLPLPLDGDPTGAFGVYAHPRHISSTAVSSDGQFMFTAGGSDQSVMQWRIDVETLHEKLEDGRPKLQHYIDAIEGGSDGELLREVVDYFYYAQIRAQGEETTAKRKIHGAIPFSQMPDLCRALGFYPSQVDIRHLTFEVMTTFANRRRRIRRQEKQQHEEEQQQQKQSHMNLSSSGENLIGGGGGGNSKAKNNNNNNIKAGGYGNSSKAEAASNPNNNTNMTSAAPPHHHREDMDKDNNLDGDENGEVLLSFEEFLRFYINHRPVLTVTNEQIERAFAALAGVNLSGSGNGGNAGGIDLELNRDALFEALSSRGEAMHSSEVVAALRSLLGDDVQLDMLEDTISARAFAENLLGFEPTTNITTTTTTIEGEG